MAYKLMALFQNIQDDATMSHAPRYFSTRRKLAELARKVENNETLTPDDLSNLYLWSHDPHCQAFLNAHALWEHLGSQTPAKPSESGFDIFLNGVATYLRDAALDDRLVIVLRNLDFTDSTIDEIARQGSYINAALMRIENDDYTDQIPKAERQTIQGALDQIKAIAAAAASNSGQSWKNTYIQALNTAIQQVTPENVLWER